MIMKKVNLKLEVPVALEVLAALDNATVGYSEEFAPSRITNLRTVMSQIDVQLDMITAEAFTTKE
jgi:hypothetical protein